MVIEAIRTFYFLRKSKKFLYSVEKLYRRKKKTLAKDADDHVLTHLAFLHEAISAKNLGKAQESITQLEKATNRWMQRGLFEKCYDVIAAITVALVVAIVVRQMWFELYTIPTGSMRPTLKETDFLVVSKDDFGLNIPLKPKHFVFDPSLVERGNIVVWTTENMGIPDSDINYFYLFPGKKQFVKRLIGKPGDTLYFYGGKLYGVDREGRELTELRNTPWMQRLEHIPFLQQEGRVEISQENRGQGIVSTFYQMNLPIAKVMAHPLGWFEGELLGAGAPAHYSDIWGMKHFAKARLLSKDEVRKLHPKALATLDEGVLYLELTHHPSVRDGKMVRDGGGYRPGLGVSVSLLPLQTEHLKRIQEHMTTCRFTVKSGVAHRLGQGDYVDYLPILPGIEDGTYEIQDGVASKVYFGGITRNLPKNHALYSLNPSLIHKLYNLGMEFLTFYEPSHNASLIPSRYAYFREESLYLLNAPVVFKEEAALQKFLQVEKDRQRVSNSKKPYLPFEDAGAPLLKDGTLDVEFIQKFGLKVPEGMYLMLGDNHPMSADSRVYGFVPEENIKGSARFLFSPPGDRWGFLAQPKASYWTFPTVIVWGSAISFAVGYYVYRRRRIRILIQKL